MLMTNLRLMTPFVAVAAGKASPGAAYPERFAR